MNRSLMRKGIIGVLSVMVLVSGGYAVKTALDFQAEATVYQEAQSSFVTIATQDVPLASIPMDQATMPVEALDQEVVVEEKELVIYLEPEISVDFDALTQANGDVMGWLHISNTDISYPVMQGVDNDEYIHTTYQNQYSAAGSIFMDYRIDGDFTANNTVIYGHNMRSGLMFGTLADYQSKSFALEHPYIFMLTDQGYLRYEVCYGFVTQATSQVYDMDFSQSGSFADHLSYLAKQSWYQTGVEITDQDKILTLSTCTSASELERFVVIAKLDESSYTLG